MAALAPLLLLLFPALAPYLPVIEALIPVATAVAELVKKWVDQGHSPAEAAARLHAVVGTFHRMTPEEEAAWFARASRVD